MSGRRTLLVTNDFPPRPGGIQRFVHDLAVRQPSDSVVVYASTWKRAAEFDARQPFEVIREDTTVLLPTRSVARRAAEIARANGCDTVWFGAAAPLGLLAPGVDVDLYSPKVDGAPIRARYGLADRPVVVCVSRLVPRKGQDTL